MPRIDNATEDTMTDATLPDDVKCPKCGLECTTGAMAAFCPQADQCEFWPHSGGDPALQGGELLIAQMWIHNACEQIGMQIDDRKRLQAEVDRLTTALSEEREDKGLNTLCVYCAEAHNWNDAEAGVDFILAHVKTCPKHPMRELESYARHLRAAVHIALEGFEAVFPQHTDEPCDFDETEDFCSDECREGGCIRWKAESLRAALAKNPNPSDPSGLSNPAQQNEASFPHPGEASGSVGLGPDRVNAVNSAPACDHQWAPGYVNKHPELHVKWCRYCLLVMPVTPMEVVTDNAENVTDTRKEA